MKEQIVTNVLVGTGQAVQEATIGTPVDALIAQLILPSERRCL